MKVAFVYPWSESLGIEYLSAVLKRHGHKCELIYDPMLFNDVDLHIKHLAEIFDSTNRILESISQIKPGIIAFSVVSDNYPWASKLAEKIKERFDIPIVFGGIHPTSLPENVILNPYVDYVIVGEGEYALLDLVEHLESGMNPKSIRNLWMKTQGKVIKNPVRGLIQNLDSLPFPDKELFLNKIPYGRYYYSLISGRGCPHSCTYCTNNFLKKIYCDQTNYLRLRSVDNVIEELEMATGKFNTKAVIFPDEIFPINLNWLKEFSHRYKKRIGLPFSCLSNPFFLNSKTINLLKNAGCAEISIGVESLDPVMNKKVLFRNITKSKVKSVIRLLKKGGIRTVTFNLFGLPGQNISEIVDFADFYNQNRVDEVMVHWLRYYPRTDIIQIARDLDEIDDSTIGGIDEGKYTLPFVKGGHSYNKYSNYVRIQLMLSLLPFIPKRLVKIILETGTYNLIPKVNPSYAYMLGLFLSGITSPRPSPLPHQWSKKHICFISKILSRKLWG